jgi:hypothetical protein
MSCFESSTFLKNPKVMNQEILKKACEKLSWKFEVKTEQNKQVLYVYDTNKNANLQGEFALKVIDNVVTYNSYYMKNGQELIKELEGQFYDLNVVYAKETILREFQTVGFKLLPDLKFVANETEKEKFKMVATTRNPNESEKRTEIEFIIKFDGTIVTDSNYIPEDIHKLADKAMEAIDKSFGTTRKEGEHIKRKSIPTIYQGKTYCSATGQIKSKNFSTSQKQTIKRN